MDNSFAVDKVCRLLGYTFKDSQLLQTAFTHSSYANQYSVVSNERLEFLGDAILDFLVADMLYSQKDSQEGEMSKLRSRLVSTLSLAGVIENKALDKFLLIGNSYVGDKATKYMMEDLFEAIVGAIYIDGGLTSAKKFVLENIDIKNYPDCDYKTRLQEYVQKKINTEPKYETMSEPLENGDFITKLVINGKPITTQTGKSKKMSQIECAKYALEHIDLVKNALK